MKPLSPLGSIVGLCCVFLFNPAFAQPVISSFSPKYGCFNTSVTITGSNFTGATSVTFGGVQATSIKVNSPTSITAVTGSGPTGLVTVTTPAGTAKSADSFFVGHKPMPYAYIATYQTSAYNANQYIDNYVDVIDAQADTLVKQVTVGNEPQCVAIDGTGGKVYVTNNYDNTVSVISTITNRVTQTIPAGPSPSQIVVSPDGGRLYVANSGSSIAPAITVINTATSAIVQTIHLIDFGETNLSQLLISPDGSTLYANGAVNSTNSIWIINAVNYSLLQQILSTGPMALSPNGALLYNVSGDSIYVFNTKQGFQLAGAAATNQPISAIAPSPDGTRVYAASITPVYNYYGQLVDQTLGLTVISTSNFAAINSVGPKLTFNGGFSNIGFTPDGSRLLIATQNQVYALNAFNNNWVAGTYGAFGGSAGYGNYNFVTFPLFACVPSITSFTPAMACTNATVQITGTNFSNATAVQFGGENAKSFTVNSPTSISAVLGRGSTGAITVTTPGGKGSKATFTAGGVPSFTISPSPLFLCNGNSRKITTNLPGSYQLSLNNGQPASVITVSTPGTYTVTAKDAAGCTNTANVIALSYANCGGYMEVDADSVANYFDTVHVKVYVRNGVNLFSAFARLNFNPSVLHMLDCQAGNYFGTKIINSAPVLDSVDGYVDFGTTQTNGQAGANGDGVLYSFRFLLKQLPQNITFDPAAPYGYVTGFSLSNIAAYNNTGAQPPSFNDISLYTDSTTLNYYVPVWPGDLNNDKVVNVADLLPIGYFYNSTGPLRPNASLTWGAQPAPLWALDKTTTSSPAFKTFADANGDGTINLVDQTAIGFNNGSAHTAWFAGEYVEPKINIQNFVPPLHVKITDSTGGKRGERYKIATVLLGSPMLPVKNLYGIAFDMFFNPAFLDVEGISTNYTGTIFGQQDVNFTKIEDRSALAAGRYSVGITRYNASEIQTGGGLVIKFILPVSASTPSGYLKLTVSPIACNDSTGGQVAVTGGIDSVFIVKIQEPQLLAQQGGTDEKAKLLHPQKLRVVLYPNPTANVAKLHIQGAAGSLVINIADITGKLMFTKYAAGTSADVELPVEMLAAGIYIVNVFDGRSNVTIKLVKGRQ